MCYIQPIAPYDSKVCYETLFSFGEDETGELYITVFDGTDASLSDGSREFDGSRTNGSGDTACHVKKSSEYVLGYKKNPKRCLTRKLILAWSF